MSAHLIGKPKAEIDQERIISALERMAALLAKIARDLEALVKARPRAS